MIGITSSSPTAEPEVRTDAAGLYNLLRQLGCATGVAVMTAVLQARIDFLVGDLYPEGMIFPSSAEKSPLAAFLAYTDCFRLLAVAAVIMIPGVLLFRVARRNTG